MGAELLRVVEPCSCQTETVRDDGKRLQFKSAGSPYIFLLSRLLLMGSPMSAWDATPKQRPSSYATVAS